MINHSSCPICGAAAQYEFSGRDLMFNRHERYDYHACTDCGAIFMHPMPSPETIAGFYPSDYDIYEPDARPPKLNWLKRLALSHRHGYHHLTAAGGFLAPLASRFIAGYAPQFVADGVLLDVGCGNGRFLSSMRALGWKVQGVEFSADGLNACLQAGLPVHHGDLASAVFPDESFDVITVRHVIEHIPQPQAFFAELSRVLKRGGQLIVETPNSEALGRQWLSVNWFANEVPRHLFLYGRDNLLRLAAQHGLSCTSSRYSSSPKILLNSLDYIIQNRGRPSKHIRVRRLLARIYVWLAQRSGKGDVIHAVFAKK